MVAKKKEISFGRISFGLLNNDRAVGSQTIQLLHIQVKNEWDTFNDTRYVYFYSKGVQLINFIRAVSLYLHYINTILICKNHLTFYTISRYELNGFPKINLGQLETPSIDTVIILN